MNEQNKTADLENSYAPPESENNLAAFIAVVSLLLLLACVRR